MRRPAATLASATTFLVAFACAATVAGCRDAGVRADLASVRDSAGIRIVENAFPDSADVAWWRIENAPLVDIGGADADELHSLFQVGDAHRLADGRIAVANAGAADVRYFSATGAHIRTSGRRGNGPGEFQQPWSLVRLPGDSLLAVEMFGGRASLLDPDGSFARAIRLPGNGPGNGVFARLHDGTLLAGLASFMEDGGLRDGLQRIPLLFVRLAPADGAVVDTTLAVAGDERIVFMRKDASGALASVEIRGPAFARSTVFAADADEIYVATQDAPQVDVYDADGALRRIVRTGAPMPEVTPEHLQAWTERMAQGAPPEIRERLLADREEPPHGTVVPPFAALLLDDDRNLWIADYDDRIHPAGHWSVHDPDGRLSARILLPARFRPTHIGDDFVLGVLRDDLDVEHVRLYRLKK